MQPNCGCCCKGYKPHHGPCATAAFASVAQAWATSSSRACRSGGVCLRWRSGSRGRAASSGSCPTLTPAACIASSAAATSRRASTRPRTPATGERRSARFASTYDRSIARSRSSRFQMFTPRSNCSFFPLSLWPMQFYPSLNRSKCCGKGICTGEFLIPDAFSFSSSTIYTEMCCVFVGLPTVQTWKQAASLYLP